MCKVAVQYGSWRSFIEGNLIYISTCIMITVIYTVFIFFIECIVDVQISYIHHAVALVALKTQRV
jgi:hypothetical protein